MTAVVTLNQLYADLERSGAAPEAVAAVADWYLAEDQWLPAQVLRWVVRKKRQPYQYFRTARLRFDSDSWNDGWYWWASVPPSGYDEEAYGWDWGHPHECRLPRSLWRLLPHSFGYEPAVFKEYPTLTDAYLALVTGWRHLVAGWAARLPYSDDPNRLPLTR